MTTTTTMMRDTPAMNIRCTINLRTREMTRATSSSSSGESVLEPQAEAFQLLSTSVVTNPTDGHTKFAQNATLSTGHRVDAPPT